jgi:hypothetical protein
MRLRAIDTRYRCSRCKAILDGLNNKTIMTPPYVEVVSAAVNPWMRTLWNGSRPDFLLEVFHATVDRLSQTVVSKPFISVKVSLFPSACVSSSHRKRLQIVKTGVQQKLLALRVTFDILYNWTRVKKQTLRFRCAE